MYECIVLTDGVSYAEKIGDIVRCKDCLYYTSRCHKDDKYEWGHCDFFKTGMNANDYCSCAEQLDIEDTAPTGFMQDWWQDLKEDFKSLTIRKDIKK